MPNDNFSAISTREQDAFIKRIGGVMVRKLGSCAVDRGVRALVQSNQRSLYWYLLFLG
jgi:hypothetical protein